MPGRRVHAASGTCADRSGATLLVNARVHAVGMAERLDPLRGSDVVAAAALYVSVFNAPPWNEHWSPDSARDRLAAMMDTPGYVGLGLWDDDGLVGFAIGHTEQYWLRYHYLLQEMCIRTDLQGKGLGSRLLAALVEQLSGFDVELVYLITMREGPAADFYSRNGFSPAGRSHVMVCRILASTP